MGKNLIQAPLIAVVIALFMLKGLPGDKTGKPRRPQCSSQVWRGSPSGHVTVLSQSPTSSLGCQKLRKHCECVSGDVWSVGILKPGHTEVRLESDLEPEEREVNSIAYCAASDK